jgi:hypothetical protein
MAKVTADHFFNGTTGKLASGYNSANTMLGEYILQQGSPSYAGPNPMAIGRPLEATTPFAVAFPHAIDVGPTQWLFLAENSTAAATRRVMKYSYNIATGVLSLDGFITLTYPAATAHTVRGLRVVRHLYTTGTASVSGTNVTGAGGAAWVTARFAAGARIGFGSTNPANITTWYHSNAIGSETSMTLVENAGTIASGPYVIEELRVYTVTTNATATNGGLFVAKGVNPDDFTTVGVTIPAATTVDNIKAVYWLADAGTNLNTIAAGMAIGDVATDTTHDIYVTNADTITSMRIYKFNGRASLAGLAAGRSTSAFLFRTGAQATTGTISQLNACRLATLGHGPGNGVSSLYFTTSTRISRCAESGIINGSVTFISDSMVEIPTGGVNTFAATSAMTSVEYSSLTDRLIITTGAGQKMYETQYNTTSTPFNRIFLNDNRQIDQSIASIGLYPFPTTQSAGFNVWVENGMAYFVRTGTTAIINHIYAFPISADWEFQSTLSTATQNRLITPSIATTGCRKFYRAVVSDARILGSDTLGVQPEPYRMYFRTAGISDNSGGWTLVDETGDISAVGPADNIQFMFEFKVVGQNCVTGRIYGVVVTYEDSSTDSRYQPSVRHSDFTNKRFAWRHATAFGSTVPTLTVRLFDAVTGTLLLTNNTVTNSAQFEKSTNDGGAWTAYNTTDKGNETTYIRFTPASLADNIKVRAIISQG